MKPVSITFLLAAICTPAFLLAGYVQPAPVTIQYNADDSGIAHGDMVSARFANNDVEHIGCGMRVWSLPDDSHMHWGFCQAGDADGVEAFCSTQDPQLLDVMKAISSYAFINFEWNAQGECTRIGFSTQSFYIPEHTNGRKPPGRN